MIFYIAIGFVALYLLLKKITERPIKIDLSNTPKPKGFSLRDAPKLVAKSSAFLSSIHKVKPVETSVDTTGDQAEPDPLVLVLPDKDSLKAQMAAKKPAQGSTRVVTIEVQASSGLPIGAAWIYLYEADNNGATVNKARRVLKFTNRTIAKLVCGPGEMRYFFKDVPYDPAKGSEDIQEEFLREIRVLLDRKRKDVDKIARASEPKPAPPPPADAAPPPVKAEPVVVPPPAPQSRAYVNREVQGKSYEGMVVEAGPTQKSGPHGPYQIFCLTINDGLTETPLTGTELERLVRENSIVVGDQVRVVSMGRCPVDVPGKDKPVFKNLYQITRLKGKK